MAYTSENLSTLKQDSHVTVEHIYITVVHDKSFKNSKLWCHTSLFPETIFLFTEFEPTFAKGKGYKAIIYIHKLWICERNRNGF